MISDRAMRFVSVLSRATRVHRTEKKRKDMLMFAVILVYVVLTTRGKLKIRLLDNWSAEKKESGVVLLSEAMFLYQVWWK